MGKPQLISTLAHELGHAHYGRTGHHPKAERLADKWAARKLLSVDLLKEHSVNSTEVTTIAASIGVMPDVVQTFIDTLNFRQAVDLMNHVAELHT